MAASWVLIPSLKSLFAAFDLIAPERDTASDGSIGDTAHQREVSDHNPDETGSVPIHDADKANEVHAIDVDNDLKIVTPGFGDPMEAVVQFLLKRCRSGAEKRLRYIIYSRRIWSASSNWVQKTYNGPSPHTEHAHFSASYTTALEASTASWHLEEIPVSLTSADKKWLEDMTEAKVAAAVKANNEAAAEATRLRFKTAPDGAQSWIDRNAIAALITNVPDGQVVKPFPVNAVLQTNSGYTNYGAPTAGK